jgi:GR25 family glycosyltransferase involved in LPS biosynthesis
MLDIIENKFITYSILALLVILGIYFSIKIPVSIDDIWLINLDKEIGRLEHFNKFSSFLPKPVNRWKATYGKDEDRINANNDGVHFLLSRSNNTEENKRSSKVLSKPGEIGCWLSHKRLLRHLRTLPVSSNTGHLILEDDVVIPEDFIKQWDTIKQTIPRYWDIIYLNIGEIRGSRINEHVIRWDNTGEWGNSGTAAYIIRHGAIDHVLEKLRFMTSPIDVQYFYMLGDLNIYIVDPQIISTNSELVSSIDLQEKRE